MPEVRIKCPVTLRPRPLSDVPFGEIWESTNGIPMFFLGDSVFYFSDDGAMLRYGNSAPQNVFVTHKLSDPIRVIFER